MSTTPDTARRAPFGRRHLALTAIAAVAVVSGALLAPATASADVVLDAQVISGEAFLSNGYTEAGSRANGSFGSDNAAPAGYHPRSGQMTDILGFRVDRAKDGWGVGTDDGDFFTPGNPFEGWAIQVGDGGTARWNNNNSTAVSGAWGSPATGAGAGEATWVSDAPIDGLGVEQHASIVADGQSLQVDVTLTNSSGADMTNVYYARAVDPDNCQTATGSPCDGSFDTTNTIFKQAAAGDGNSVVTATAADGSFIGLRADGANSMVASGSACGSLQQIYDETGSCVGNLLSTKGAFESGDINVVSVIKVPSLIDGDSVVVSVTYFLSEAASDEANGPTATVPDAPTDLVVAPRNGGLRVTFTPPASDGGSAITSYEVKVGAGAWQTITTSSASGGRLTGVISGLSNGVTYSVQVRAVNLIGAGDPGSSVSGIANAAELPAIDRAGHVAVPAQPKAYHGRRAWTTAFETSRNGTDAHPIPELGHRQLLTGEAATLSDDGLFAFDSSKLTGVAKSQLRTLAGHLVGANAITCEGYTDYAGAAAHEKALSLARAKAVCSALRAAGAEVTTRSLGYGGTRPVIVGGSANSRSANRRVVVYVRS